VYVYHVSSDNFDSSYEFLRKNGLVFFPTNKSGKYKGFSHKHRPVKSGDPYTLYGAVVRLGEEKYGEQFAKFSKADEETKKADHIGIGKLLGYPTCCTKFFNENWGHPSVDPQYEAAVNTPKTKVVDDVVTVSCHPYCNNMLRYFGLRITPHLVHSMQCKKTIKWGEEWIEIMRQIDDEATDWLIELLSMPLTWSAYKGVVIIDTPLFRAVSNSDTTLVKKVVNNLGWKSTVKG